MKNYLIRVATIVIIAMGLFLTSATKAQNYSSYPYEGATANSIPMNGRDNIASDSYGNVFIADADNNRVLMVHTNGAISTFAGTGAIGFWGDGGPAVSAVLNYPSGVAVDAQGNVYIADTRNNRIRMVNMQGIITTIAGTGAQGFAGDGGPSIYAALNQPTSITVDANRNIYIADNYNNRVRMINGQSGTIYTIAGNGGTYFQQNVAMTQPAYIAPAPQPVTYQSYYDELSPYGQWVNTPEYGNVWVPSAGADFVPYSTAGHWVFTSYGWTWVSDYSWGWCAFHYGRWDHDNYMGWFWVPGNEWGPAWVSWRSGNGYYGWAPLPPAYGAVSETNYYNVPSERYVFVRSQYITDPYVYNHYEPREQSVTYVNTTTVINRTYVDNDTHVKVYAGPQKEEVERYTSTPVKVYAINNSDKPGQTAEDKTSNALVIYRPKIQKPSEAPAGKVPAPTHVYAKEEIKPVAERQVITHPKQEAAAPSNGNEQHKDMVPVHTPENAPVNKDDMHTGTSANNQPVKVQPATQVKDMPLGKDEKGNVVYQDEKGGKYYVDEKGAKVVAPAATQIKEKQVGKDATGHVIYQDAKGNKYYTDEKGKKIIVPATNEKKVEPVKPN